MTDYKTVEGPNFTQIPNVFFDYWMAILSPGEFKILMCIARKTFGWHKDNDSISLSQIVKMTGLSRRGVVKVIAKLEKIKLIICRRNQSEEYGCVASTFKILVHEPEKVSENTQARELSAPPPRELSAPPLGNSVHPQKKDLTKEKEKQQHKLKQKSIKPPKASKNIVVVFSFLKKIKNLPHNLAAKLSRDFAEREQELKDAVEKLGKSTAEITNPYGWLVACVEEGYEMAVSQEEKAKENHKWWMETCNRGFDGKRIAGVTIISYLQSVQLSGSNSGPAGEVTGEYAYADPEFRQKIAIALQKLKKAEKGG